MTTETRIFHVLSTGLTVPLAVYGPTAMDSRVLYRGQEFTVTPELYEDTKDRYGVSWLDLTEAEQLAKFGEIRFAEGPAPEGMEIGTDDENVLYQRGLRARQYAEQISDPGERFEALKKVHAEYGAALNPKAQS